MKLGGAVGVAAAAAGVTLLFYPDAKGFDLFGDLITSKSQGGQDPGKELAHAENAAFAAAIAFVAVFLVLYYAL
jgi:hypothetical protein